MCVQDSSLHSLPPHSTSDPDPSRTLSSLEAMCCPDSLIGEIAVSVDCVVTDEMSVVLQQRAFCLVTAVEQSS